MILDTHRSASPHLVKARLGFFTSAAAGVAIIALCLGPRLVLAGNQSADLTPEPDRSAAKTDLNLNVTQPQLSIETNVRTSVQPDVAATPDLVQRDAPADAEQPNTPEPPGVGPGPKFKPAPPLPAAPRAPRAPRAVRPEPVPQAINLPPAVSKGWQMSGGPASAGEAIERTVAMTRVRVNMVMIDCLLLESDDSIDLRVRS